MSKIVIINNSGWILTTFCGGVLGRVYELEIPNQGMKIFTEEEFIEFFNSLPDRGRHV